MPGCVAPVISSFCQEIGVALHRRRVPDIGDLDFAIGAAEPVELGRVEAHARRLEQRRGRHSIDGCADDGAVARLGIVERARHREACGARLVLDDDGRIARDIFADSARHDARADVVTGARRRTDDEADLLALIEGGDVLLRMGRRGSGKAEQGDGNEIALHGLLRFLAV